MDEYLNLAQKTIESFVRNGKAPAMPADDLPPEILTKRAGVFVSLHTKTGDLRGCIGTFLPTKKNIAEEIIHNAIAAATQDPRFPPVGKEELPDLIYSVDILSAPKEARREEISPKIYGLIVSSTDGRRGLLLPDLEGVDIPEQQIEICKMKAGIYPEEPITFRIFTVKRHE